MRWSNSRSGQAKGLVGVKRLFPVCPVAIEGLYMEEYTCSTTCLCILQFTHVRFWAFGKKYIPRRSPIQVLTHFQRSNYLATSVGRSLTRESSWYLNHLNWVSSWQRSEFMDRPVCLGVDNKGVGLCDEEVPIQVRQNIQHF